MAKYVFVQGALVRLEWRGVVEVPDDITEEELSDLEELIYQEVDGGEYEDDPDYWERGQSTHFEIRPPAHDKRGHKPVFKVTRDDDRMNLERVEVG